MEATQTAMAGTGSGQGPRYCVNTEGTEHEWLRSTITTEEIAGLGGWDPSIGVVKIDEENNERTLSPGEIVELRPGHAFCRRIRFRRGLVSGNRLMTELATLQRYFPTAERRDNWFQVSAYPIPAVWGRDEIKVAFRLNDGHPAAAPYGFFVPSGLRIHGALPTNYTEPALQEVPFDGSWGMFSWQPEDWRAATEPVPGYSLAAWVRSFALRFAELN